MPSKQEILHKVEIIKLNMDPGGIRIYLDQKQFEKEMMERRRRNGHGRYGGR